MLVSKLECPSCGAKIDSKSESCQFCGSQLNLKKIKKDFFASMSLEGFGWGCLEFNKKPFLNSIKDVLDILANQKYPIPPKLVRTLLLPNNNISDLKGIEKFENLEEINLINNKITSIDSNITEYLKKRIYAGSTGVYCRSLTFENSPFRPSFILCLNGNDKLDYNFLNNLNLSKTIPKEYRNIFENTHKGINYGQPVKSTTFITDLNTSSVGLDSFSKIKAKINSVDNIAYKEWLGYEYSNNLKNFEINSVYYKTISKSNWWEF